MKLEDMSALQKQKAMIEAQEKILRAMADTDKSTKAGVSLSITGEQLAQYPMLMQFYEQLMQKAAQEEQGKLQLSQQMASPPPPAQGPQRQPQLGAPAAPGSGVPVQHQPVPAAA